MAKNASGADVRSVTIVVLAWNGLAYTRRCVETVLRNTDYPAYRILVVDNGSTDGTWEYIERQEILTSIRNPANLGFAKGSNIGIRAADPLSDIVLLNNDTEIHQPDWLWQLQRAAYDAPTVGPVGCRMVRPDGLLEHAGAYMPLDTFWGQHIGAGERNVNQYSRNRDVEGVVFACVYLKRELLRTAGLLDEDYGSYFEDTDYCLRAAKLGYRTVCCGSVTIFHHENVSTRINRVEHRDLFLKAQKVFRSKWERKLSKTRYTREIGWHSLFNFTMGYAIHSRELACALDRHGVHVAYRYVYGPGTVRPVDEPDRSGSYMIDVIRRRKLHRDRVQVVFAQGDVLQSNFGSYKVGFTMLETDRIPREWVRQANCMDEIWTPSQFNARTFRESGVDRPIHVIPLGIDPNYFHPEIAAHPIPGIFTFLSIFEWGERKAPELLLRAFNQEFRASEPVILLVKTLNSDVDLDVRAQVAGLGLDPEGGRIHISLNQEAPAGQLGSIYRSADCFVLPTHGEGWGMPILEAMACGLPVIATDWSAPCDFMNAGNAYPLPIEGLVAARAKCPYYAGFNWAQPSCLHLRGLMRHVFENQEEARAKGARASADVHANWTWDHSARKIVARLDAIKQGRA
jgi:GT2 family glycosyltransferase